MAGIYNGHILEFPQIRVDCFSSPRPGQPWEIPQPRAPSPSSSSNAAPSSSKLVMREAPPARLFLLTHIHTDHLEGLSNEFTGQIICSLDTKRMLLKLEYERDKLKMEDGITQTSRVKFAGLRARLERGETAKQDRIVDRIEALPYGYSKYYELCGDDLNPKSGVTITLLDANHCPGSTMFLITSPNRAVLHTGDIRCDKLFMNTLMRTPAIQEFIVPASTFSSGMSVDCKSLGKGKGREIEEGVRRLRSGRRVLDRIYLDTSAVLGTGDMPDKEESLRDLLDQMSLYPPDTVFFLNVWCFGWEDVIKAVARYFDSPVHVDRYKATIFKAAKSDPFLSACTTDDPTSTRFHACERRAKCVGCRTFNDRNEREWNRDKRIVHVNMVEVKSAAWALEKEEFLAKLGQAAIGEGYWPTNILCPIARHSPLPELQSLVRLFRPHAVSPNTVVPQCQGLDYFLLPDFLSDHIQPGAYDHMILERDTYFISKHGLPALEALRALKASGVKLEQMIGGEFGSERDDFLPDQSLVKTEGIASKRSAHAADQLQRAGGMAFGSMSAAFAAIGSNGGRDAGRRDGEEEGYSTDEESGPRKRRRRGRQITPAWSQEEEMGDCKKESIKKSEMGYELDKTGEEAENEVEEKLAVKQEAEQQPEIVMKAGEISKEPLKAIKLEKPESTAPSLAPNRLATKSPSKQSKPLTSSTSISAIKAESDPPSPAVKVERSSRASLGPRKFVVNMAHVKALALAEKESMG